MALITYDFDKNLLKLNEKSKELVSLGQWSLYRIQQDQYLLITDGGCSCCHGDRKRSYYLLDQEGSVIRNETSLFYENLISNEEVRDIITFSIPDRISQFYLRI